MDLAIRQLRTMRRKPIYCAIAAAMVTCCHKPEPIEHGSYYIDNRTAEALHLSIVQHWDDGNQLNEIIPPDTLLRFMDVTQGSGGHVLPSNFIKRFTVTRTDSLLGEVVVYEGVRNGDWRREDLSSGRTDLVLLIE